MKYLGVDIKNGDILLIGKRVSTFYWLWGTLLLPWDLVRRKPLRLIDDFTFDRIQTDTLSVWNHIEILTTDHPSGRVSSIGSHTKGVVESFPEDHYDPEHYSLAILRPRRDLTDGERLVVVNKARSLLGHPYSFSSILKLRWKILRGGLREMHVLKRDPNGDSAVICSQLVDVVWREIYDILPNCEDYPAPRTFYDSTEIDRLVVLI